jgi:hypothetical protein
MRDEIVRTERRVTCAMEAAAPGTMDAAATAAAALAMAAAAASSEAPHRVTAGLHPADVEAAVSPKAAAALAHRFDTERPVVVLPQDEFALYEIRHAVPASGAIWPYEGLVRPGMSCVAFDCPLPYAQKLVTSLCISHGLVGKHQAIVSKAEARARRVQAEAIAATAIATPDGALLVQYILRTVECPRRSWTAAHITINAAPGALMYVLYHPDAIDSMLLLLVVGVLGEAWDSPQAKAKAWEQEVAAASAGDTPGGRRRAKAGAKLKTK